jgi:hypothetical protein
VRFYLVKILFVTEPFEFRHLKVYNHESGAKELKNLKNWRYEKYHILVTSRRVAWTEKDSNLHNVYLQLPVEELRKIPPLNRVCHAFVSHVMPYITHTKDTLETPPDRHH